MRVRRGNLYATAMRQRNGAAKRKPQAHTASAIGQTMVGGVERLKDTLAVLGSNARAVIGHRARHASIAGVNRDHDMRACGRVGNGIVHQVYHQLHHQARIDIDERRLIARHHLKIVLAHGRIYMAQRLLDDIVHELERGRQMHAAALEFGDGEQVLDGGVEPQRIRANG